MFYAGLVGNGILYLKLRTILFVMCSPWRLLVLSQVTELWVCGYFETEDNKEIK